MGLFLLLFDNGIEETAELNKYSIDSRQCSILLLPYIGRGYYNHNAYYVNTRPKWPSGRARAATSTTPPISRSGAAPSWSPSSSGSPA